jgi:hypothetical protein
MKQKREEESKKK